MTIKVHAPDFDPNPLATPGSVFAGAEKFLNDQIKEKEDLGREFVG